jgi:hypothetical protein
MIYQTQTAGKNHIFRTDSGTVRATLSSTGLAVTGALSSTTGANFATSSGNVGIGVTNPFAKLDVEGRVNIGTGTSQNTFIASSPQLQLFTDGGTANSLGIWQAGIASGEFGVKASDSNLYITNTYSQVLGTASHSITLTNAGNVGIGTSSPVSKLDVVETATIKRVTSGNNMDLNFYNGSGAGTAGNVSRIRSDGDGISNDYGALSFWTGRIATAAITERMRIDSSGNVGIGTTSQGWFGGWKALDISSAAAISGSGNGAILWGNSYLDTSVVYRYKNNGYAVNYVVASDVGKHIWQTAPSGTAGNSFTFTSNMTLDNTGLNFFTNATNPASSGASKNGLNFGYDNGTEVCWIQANRNNISEIRTLQLNPNGGPVTTGAALTVGGALSKASGSFRIEHPLPAKSATHQLVHSFIEGPQADLIYRGKVVLVDGKASVNIDAAATMTDGTFEVLCRDVQCFTTNETGWTAVRGKVVGNILTIEAKDADCTDEISWMVIGERQDPHMMETDWTDDNGKVIVEPLKPSIEPIQNT